MKQSLIYPAELAARKVEVLRLVALRIADAREAKQVVINPAIRAQGRTYCPEGKTPRGPSMLLLG
jgi:hypothetical protein